MSTLTHTMSDSVTMFRRDLVHQRRYPSVTVMLIAMPVVFLLLFVFVFGGTLGDGIEGAGGRQGYLEYVVPGVLLMAIAAVAQGTCISVAKDMTEGIIARFRTMAISRAAVLTGHVGGAMFQTVLGLAVVVVMALALGFRPTATPIEWVATIALLTLITFAFTWLTVALGINAASVETASNSPMFLLLLPFLGSAFVPTESMPTAVQWFADHQPFTPMIETVRGLLVGTPIGNDGIVSIVWCVVIAGASYLWARSSYDRRSVR